MATAELHARATLPFALAKRFPTAAPTGADWLSTRWHVEEGGKRLLLRVLRPELVSASSRTGHAARALVAWRAQLALRHPAFPAVHDLGAAALGEGVAAWVLTDRTEATSLRALVAERPLAPPIAANLLAQVVRALEEASPHGPHLGLTPDTVGVEIEPVLGVRLPDHGLLAAFAREAPTVALADGGRSAWFAPEQLSGRASGAQTDLWQVGALLRYALTGCNPAEYVDESELGAPASALVCWLMAADPLDRPDDYASVIARLEVLAAGVAGEPTPSEPTLRLSGKARAPVAPTPPVWLEFAAPLAAAAFALAAFALFLS